MGAEEWKNKYWFSARWCLVCTREIQTHMQTHVTHKTQQTVSQIEVSDLRCIIVTIYRKRFVSHQRTSSGGCFCSSINKRHTPENMEKYFGTVKPERRRLS